MNLKRLAQILDGDVCGDHVLAPGPGHSPHDRSLAVFLDPSAPDLFRTHSFAADDFKTCRDYVKARLGLPDYPIPLTTQPWKSSDRKPDTDTQRRRSDRAIELWNHARTPLISPVETYLAARGIWPPPGTDALRYHFACPFTLEDGTTISTPAMLGLFRDITTNEPTGLHRTALTREGTKSKIEGLDNPKRMLGRAKGAAIKLSPDSAVSTGLGIAEGIETALTAISAGWHPVWALGSAGAISAFPILPGIETLSIFTDADPAGLAAAKACRKRWRDAGRECNIILPPVDGQDWNDVARGATA